MSYLEIIKKKKYIYILGCMLIILRSPLSKISMAIVALYCYYWLVSKVGESAHPFSSLLIIETKQDLSSRYLAMGQSAGMWVHDFLKGFRAKKQKLFSSGIATLPSYSVYYLTPFCSYRLHSFMTTGNHLLPNFQWISITKSLSMYLYSIYNSFILSAILVFIPDNW